MQPLVHGSGLPPALHWPRGAAGPVPDQPVLDLLVAADPPRPAGAVRSPRARWAARPLPGLPDAGAWAGRLAVAAVQALLGERPVGQLERWVTGEVLAGLSVGRRHRAGTGRPGGVQLASLRVQHPVPQAAEVAGRLLVGGRTVALALRLEARGERWLCTALELAPRRPVAERTVA